MEKAIVSQEDRWQLHLAEVRAYVAENKRLPSKYRVENRRLLNWLKYNRKLLAAGLLPEGRRELFQELMDFCAQYHHVNQYE